MNIWVKGYLTFRDVIGDITILENEAGSHRLGQLLERLSIEHEESLGYKIFESGDGRVREHIAVLVNGVHYSHLPDRLETELNDGDEIAIFPPIAGG